MKVLNKGFLLFLLSVFVICNTGCKEKLIPQRDMVNILSEIFITDEMVKSNQFVRTLHRRDTIDYYSSIFKKYGYNELQFVHTLDYYLENITELEKIMDKVVANLSVLEAESTASSSQSMERSDVIESDIQNLWKQKTHWKWPEDGDQNSLSFSIPVKGPGIYTVSALTVVQPDDQAQNPSMQAWFHTKDEPPEFQFNPQAKAYQKDGKKRTVSIRFELTDTTMTHFMGNLMSHQAKTGDWKKQAEMWNIRITFLAFDQKSKTPKSVTLKVDNYPTSNTQ